MAFGGPVIDQNCVTRRFPGLAQVTGLLANALGWHHCDAERLERLQQRLRFASVILRAGREMIDYQTVDLGQRHLVDTGWTTRGTREDRGKGAATRQTHIRFRHFQADGALLVALALEPAAEAPTLADLAAALDQPARPLFIGRKSCLPTTPILVGTVHADELTAALGLGLGLGQGAGLGLGSGKEGAPAAPACQPRDTGALAAEWPARPGVCEPWTERVIDQRDWRNQFHHGERLVANGRLPGTEAPPANGAGAMAGTAAPQPTMTTTGGPA